MLSRSIVRCVTSSVSRSASSRGTHRILASSFSTPQMPRDPVLFAEVCAACECEAPCGVPAIPIADKYTDKIDYKDALFGTVKPYRTQFIVTSGVDANSWPKHLAMEEPDSFMNELEDQTKTLTDADQFRVNCISRGPRSGRSDAVDVFAFESNGNAYVYRDIVKGQMKLLVDSYIHNTRSDALLCENVDENWILTCGHGKKDLRCGVFGKAIDEQLTAVLQKRGLEKVQHDLVSHIGGHKFAGNIIIYAKNKLKCVWYGRVTPAHIDNIVHSTFNKQEIIPTLLRGRTGAWSPE